MYYSKNGSPNITVPRNYSGNTFRVIDESERHYIENPPEREAKSPEESLQNTSPRAEQNGQKAEQKSSILPSIFTDISVEDVLLLGLMLVIHQENPNDVTLLLLLILLLAK